MVFDFLKFTNTSKKGQVMPKEMKSSFKAIGWDQNDKKQMKNLRTEAYKTILETLDLVTIVREINSLKVLTHLLMKEHHMALVPALSLKLHLNSHQNPPTSMKEPETPLSPNKLSPRKSMSLRDSSNLRHIITNSANIPEASKSFMKALNTLEQRYMSQKERENDEEPHNLDEKLDFYFYNTIASNIPVTPDIKNANNRRKRVFSSDAVELNPVGNFKIEADASFSNQDDSRMVLKDQSNSHPLKTNETSKMEACLLIPTENKGLQPSNKVGSSCFNKKDQLQPQEL
jgi:hypothetical protein